MKKNFVIMLIFLITLSVVQGQTTILTTHDQVKEYDRDLTLTRNSSTINTGAKVFYEDQKAYFYVTNGSRVLKFDFTTHELIKTSNDMSTSMIESLYEYGDHLYISAGGSSPRGEYVYKLDKDTFEVINTTSQIAQIYSVYVDDDNVYVSGSAVTGFDSRVRVYDKDTLDYKYSSPQLNKLSSTNSLVRIYGQDEDYLYVAGTRSTGKLFKLDKADNLSITNQYNNVAGFMSDLSVLLGKDKDTYLIPDGSLVKLDENLTLINTSATLTKFGTGSWYLSENKFDDEILSHWLVIGSTSYHYFLDKDTLDIEKNINGTLNIKKNVFVQEQDTEPSGINKDFSDTGLYNFSFGGGFFNLGPKETYTINLSLYFDDLEEFFLVGSEGEELSVEGSLYNYTLPKTRTINGKVLTQEKTVFTITKTDNETITITTEEHELLGLYMYGSAFGVPIYNSYNQRISTTYYNLGVQVIGGINRNEKPVTIISQEQRDNGENIYFVDLFSQYATNGVSNLVSDDGLLIHNLDLFFTNPYQELFEASVKPFTLNSGIVTGLNLSNFVCETNNGVNNSLCVHQNIYFEINLYRDTGVMRIVDKGILELVDVNGDFKVFTYRPTVYVGTSIVPVSDSFLDIGFVQTASEEASTTLPVVPVTPIASQLSPTTKMLIALAVPFFVLLILIGIGFSIGQVALLSVIGSFLAVGFVIFFALISFIPGWVLITMLVLTAMIYSVFIIRIITGRGDD